MAAPDSAASHGPTYKLSDSASSKRPATHSEEEVPRKRPSISQLIKTPEPSKKIVRKIAPPKPKKRTPRPPSNPAARLDNAIGVLQDLREELGSSRAENEWLKQEADSKDGQIAALQRNSGVQGQALIGLAYERDQLKAKLEQSNKEGSSWRTEVEGLKSRLQSQDRMVRETEETLATVTSRSHRYRNAALAQADELDKSMQRMEELVEAAREVLKASESGGFKALGQALEKLEKVVDVKHEKA